VRIVVNHVTRMKSPRICVAGIDPETLEHVRPVTHRANPLTRALLREKGGPFGPGALVELGSVVPCPRVPETEDRRFAPARATRTEDVSHEAYLELLGRVGHQDLATAFGPDLVEIRPRKMAVPAGRGTRSLAVLKAVNPRLEIKFDKLYLELDDASFEVELRVTDARFYEDDQVTVKRRVVSNVNVRLARGGTIYAMLGLAHAIRDDDGGEVHWLQANGICLADRAVSDTP
jgi:hypothetical protein